MPRGGARARIIGRRVEHLLRKRLERAGWSVLRAPASGAGSSTPVPDIIAVKGGHVLVFEAKYRTKPRSIFIEPWKYDGIRRWAENAGAAAFLAVKIRGEDDFRVVPWERAEHYTSERGEWYVFYKDVIDRAETLAELLARLAEQPRRAEAGAAAGAED